MSTERELASALLGGASVRLVRAVDGLRDDEWSAPSRLPGWTRAHVVAHLALNAEGIARALRSLTADGAEDHPRTMYDSDEKRDSDIDELATAVPGEIRDRFMAGTTILDEAVGSVPEDEWETRIERTPGGRAIRADAFPGMRLRELEIHHVDLDTGYTPSDWSARFAIHLLDAMSKRFHPPQRFEVRPLDVNRVWSFGPDGDGDHAPVVTGPAADLGWWLTGRPPPDTLHCSRGELPSIEGW